jgi:hypothetical protein
MEIINKEPTDCMQFRSAPFSSFFFLSPLALGLAFPALGAMSAAAAAAPSS